MDSIPRDTSAMTKLTRTLILQYAASSHLLIEASTLKPHSSAFLRGSADTERVLGMKPPGETRARLKLRLCEVVQSVKGANGRVDAPCLWFRELKQALESLGFKQSPFDPCMFSLTHPTSGRTEGLLWGSAYFQSKLAMLEKRFPFGSRKAKEFTFSLG